MRTTCNKGILGLFFIFICIFLMGFNYLVASFPRDFKYSISQNYEIYELKSSDKSIRSLDFLKSYDSVVVIAETKNPEVIGLYDPTMYYYGLSTKFVDPEELRYFSKNDYNQNKNVGILNKSIDILMQGANFSKIAQDAMQRYDVEVINYFDSSSAIFEETEVAVIKNLFALNSNQVCRIYVVNKGEKKVEEIEKSFQKNGWDKFEEERKKLSFIEVMTYYSDFGKYPKFIYRLIIISFILFLYMLHIYLDKYERFIRISRFFGGKDADILKLFVKKAVWESLVVGTISSLSMVAYLTWNKMNYISLENILIINGILVIANFLTVFIKVSLKIRRNKVIMR